MDTFELLTHAGLSKKEAAVYTALLERGALSLMDISRDTHINRPALYELLPRMQKKGLVSLVKNKRRVQYKAESPDHILRAYRENHKDIADRLEALSLEYGHAQHDKPLIKYFEGRHGVIFVFDDVAHTLPRGGAFFRYSARKGKDLPDFEQSYYRKTRDTKRIERLVITSADRAKEKEPKLDRHVKAIPKDFDLFEDNISLVIYGDKIAYIDYESNTAFIVESHKIARFQEKLFKLLYKKL
jgi:sugar-specific transcriptional regulator TrmB